MISEQQMRAMGDEMEKIALGARLMGAARGAAGHVGKAAKGVVGGVRKVMSPLNKMQGAAGEALSGITGIPDPNRLARGIGDRLFGR